MSCAHDKGTEGPSLGLSKFAMRLTLVAMAISAVVGHFVK
jgi:hypothetical protein